MTKTKTIDKRQYATPTFEMLQDGDAFTVENRSTVFVKTEIMYDKDKNPFNTISLDGEFYWSEDDEEIEPVQELEIIIKR